MSAFTESASPDARRTRATHPKGFEVGIRWSPETHLPTSAAISSDHEVAAADHRATIETQTGHTIPPDVDVRIERLTLQHGLDGKVERWWYKYVFPLKATAAHVDDYDHLAALKAMRRDRGKRTPTFTGESTFVLSWNDWQAGKSAGGGTPALLARFDVQVETAIARAKELRKIGRTLGRLVIIGGGDMIEGCTIYPNQSFELDLDGRRRQINVVVDMILNGLDRIAPMFEVVTVLAIGGNHGEHRINGNRTSRHDNDDCLVFEIAARAVARDPRLEHVDFVIAQDEPAKTLDVNGWVLATTHGQAFGKGAGSAEAKAHGWYKGQAGGHLPAGDAHLLVSHHYHHKAERDWGACLWVQTCANDGGSPQHTDLTGDFASSGMLSWVMTPASRYQDSQIL